MVYAIYRCLYGEDFIEESFKSIENYVDKVFVFWDNIPWGDVKECIYKNKRIAFPEKFDTILDKINNFKFLTCEKFVIYDHQYDNMNQFTHFINDIILPNYEKPDTIMIIEVDHVFKKDQIELAFEEFNTIPNICATTRQVEIWKGFKHRVPERMGRCGVNFWKMNKLKKLPNTLRQGNIGNMKVLKAHVHNFGFAVSEKVMYWKHMTALGFSQKIGDTPPDENWYEEKWLQWNYENNNNNLEISKGYEYMIPKVIPYSIDALPELIYAKIKKSRRI